MITYKKVKIILDVLRLRKIPRIDINDIVKKHNINRQKHISKTKLTNQKKDMLKPIVLQKPKNTILIHTSYYYNNNNNNYYPKANNNLIINQES